MHSKSKLFGNPFTVLIIFMLSLGFAANSFAASADLQPSALTFKILGQEQGSFVIATASGDSGAIYDLSGSEFSFQTFDYMDSESLGAIETPLFCFDFSSEGAADDSAIFLNVTDSNGRPVLESVPVPTGLTFRPITRTLEFVPGPRLQCFYIGDGGEPTFGLFGVAPPEPPPPQNVEPDHDAVFRDGFEFFGMTGVDVRFAGLPEAVVAGGVLDYSLVITNTGDASLSSLAFQESFPENGSIFPAVLEAGTWICDGVHCPASSGTGLIRFTGLTLPVGESMEFAISRPVRTDASAGSSLSLYAGAVAGPGSDADFAVDQASLAVIGPPFTLRFVPDSDVLAFDEERTLVIEVHDEKGNRVFNDVDRTIQLSKVNGSGPGRVDFPQFQLVRDGRAEFIVTGEVVGQLTLIAVRQTGGGSIGPATISLEVTSQ